MSYEKQVWSKYDDLKPEDENIENGAVVTDSRMNHMEDGIEDSSSTLENHVSNKVNPHAVTKTQVGLGNVDNIEQAAKTDFDAHVSNTSNPHEVTKSQIGLEKVVNVEQASKSNFDSHASNKSNPHAVTASQTGAYTKSEVASLISSAITQSKLDANPVGSIITTINDINPSTYLGGTWMRFAQGRTLVGVDETDDVTLMKTANNTGGSTNPLTNHQHKLPSFGNQSYTFAWGTGSLTSPQISISGTSAISGNSTNNGLYTRQDDAKINSSGDNSNHNNWQPFVTVYFWRRTA
ncbi:phage baseplate protein [Lactococcus raffinolactis]|uniref:phage baseplate protein n=1 Tax=Pseudolactococcus raffinolactis TaxID=1366 RepID=UPI00241737AF|nr:hypothetical protein [Lactococcus raffinolactis]MDG4961486.1 hypothetical protein [Lactococcus raffinolactis]